jgi:uncharacterized membrane protein
MTKKAIAISLGLFFVVAGLNHFVNPGFYLPLIPGYLPFPDAINVLSGAIEIVLGAALFFSATRKVAAFGVIALLVAFVPSHVHFIEIGSCVAGSLCVPAWVAWLRLVVIHPLLILWAYRASKV